MSDTQRMDTAAELAALAAILDALATAKQRRIRLYLAGPDMLRYEAPRGAMTADLRETFRAHKPAIIRFLAAARGDIEQMAYEVDALYCQLLRVELLDWGRAHRYPRLTVAYRPGATGASVPYRWVMPGQRAWSSYISGFRRPDLTAAYAETQRLMAGGNGKESEGRGHE